ncbi:CRP/FNR family transcriptional regulator, anaerobic regulatory protein [Paenibacillus uliginis N3/975]|uniref:CRP/FNR family transcriptional regulator, anaerobic regulatory protein n=1 Tax=Paenibacillus uliginis N3/975 TaxID=1313296 RepID=A0A1X7HB23_9BACL|nr:Crp/Fnr family transcriptional regulator [Paenibacillus uliginis]SMF83116.1 CRP/FNR family transcriptional regulator, anaerobic regulatory protein [Paenibacillus uliginis N3/975]
MAMTIEHQQTFKTCGKRTERKTGSSEQYGIAQYLSEEQFQYLQDIMQTRKITKGSYLFWEGDKADKLYFIISGQVKLLKSTEEGKDLIISILQNGDLIAQFNGLQNAQYSYSAETMSNVQVGVILRKDLDELLSLHGDIAIQFMYWLGMNNQVIETKLRDLLLFGKAGALASTLIRMSNTYGIPAVDGSIHIQLKLTNTELGEMIGCTRESVNRMLGDWKNDGTIEFEEGKMIIRQIAHLREICRCPDSPRCPVAVCRL